MPKQSGETRSFASEKKRADETVELVVTLSVPKKRIVKVETLEPSGARFAMPDEDVAELVGDEQETLVAALEEAYAAGADDALAQDDSEDRERNEPHRTVLWEADARQDLRRSVRRLILGRAIQRLSSPQRHEPAQTAKKGTSNGKRSGVWQ